MKNLRLLLWAYFLLLIFEGALRKWIVPALDAPLLVIRDPVVLWIYYEAYRNRLFFNNAFFMPTIVLAIFLSVVSTLAGAGTPFITAYGIHADFLQIPLIFLMPQIFHRDDVLFMGKIFLYLAIFMAALCIYQFKSPQDSLINKGAMNTWYGTVRPSGTFSFVSGPVAFFPLAVAFIYQGFLKVSTYPIPLLVIASLSIMMASACSGSRSVLVSIGIVTAVAILCVLIRGKGIGGMLIAAVGLVLLLQLLALLPVFQDGTSQLFRRFADSAANNEDAQGMLNRYAGTMAGPLASLGNSTSLFGSGLGLGTNAAAGLLTGEREFLGAEDEWGRLIFECGPIFGVVLIIYRVLLGFTIGKRAYGALMRDNLLPALIYSSCALLVINGQWGVPTSLGFAIFGAGLTLSACEEPEDNEEEYDEDGEGVHEDDHSEDEADHSPAGDKVA